MNAKAPAAMLAVSAILFGALSVRCRNDESASVRLTGNPSPQWIGPAADPHPSVPSPCPILRFRFPLDAKPRQGTVRVVGLGHYQLRLNGKQVGDTVINQAWSAYDKTLFTQDFDISGLLRKGENVFGMMLGNSFWHIGASNDTARYRGYPTDFSNGRPYVLWLEACIRTTSATG